MSKLELAYHISKVAFAGAFLWVLFSLAMQVRLWFVAQVAYAVSHAVFNGMFGWVNMAIQGR